MVGSGFQDILPQLHAQARAKNAGWRIDYFLVSNRVADQITQAVSHSTGGLCPKEIPLGYHTSDIGLLFAATCFSNSPFFYICCFFGNVTVNFVKEGLLSTATVPPWSSTTRLTTARPMPLPSVLWERSAW